MDLKDIKELLGIGTEKAKEVKEDLQKEIKEEVKQSAEKHLPEPFKDMLHTKEGTYALIALAVALGILLFKISGTVLKIFIRIVFVLALAAAVYFAYLHFYG
ncbi:MAG: hypothetical protein GXO45_00850 [Aquificae bacterium]|nr:hypothetical protein [Aquificota bacterium]